VVVALARVEQHSEQNLQNAKRCEQFLSTCPVDPLQHASQSAESGHIERQRLKAGLPGVAKCFEDETLDVKNHQQACRTAQHTAEFFDFPRHC
jgi:hypothetical protein